jgi:hypothetical protein
MNTQFSSNPLCHGISLIVSPWISGEKLTLLKRPHWSFFIVGPYAPGDLKQFWSLSDPDPKGSTFGGEGEPKEIAQEVCGTVNGTGGSLTR